MGGEGVPYFGLTASRVTLPNAQPFHAATARPLPKTPLSPMDCPPITSKGLKNSQRVRSPRVSSQSRPNIASGGTSPAAEQRQRRNILRNSLTLLVPSSRAPRVDDFAHGAEPFVKFGIRADVDLCVDGVDGRVGLE